MTTEEQKKNDLNNFYKDLHFFCRKHKDMFKITECVGDTLNSRQFLEDDYILLDIHEKFFKKDLIL